MALHRKDGAEQPYIPLGIFKLRIPFIHYRYEVAEGIQAIFMCATCLGAIPVLTQYLGVPYEIAWSMVVINGCLYFLHALLGDPVVPGWITPAIPVVLAYLGNYTIGPERIKALVALQIMVGVIFLIMGITGIAGKLMRAIPVSIQAGILLGAAVAAVIGEIQPALLFKGKDMVDAVVVRGAGRAQLFPYCVGFSGLFAYFLLFSKSFQNMRKKSIFLDMVGKFGMLPAILLGVVLGPLFKELPVPNFDLSYVTNAGKTLWLVMIPDMNSLLDAVSPLRLGWPQWSLYVAAIPTAIAAYIIAFGDFVTTEVLITDADEARTDEKIDFNANRSNLISALRNFIMAIVAPYTQLCGPLWAAVTVSTAQRYKEGRKGMDSIFSGVGSFRLTTALTVAIIPIAEFVRPVLPVALSITLLVQGYACASLGMRMLNNDMDRGIAGVMAAVLATLGAAWGLGTGIVLYFLLAFTLKKKEAAKA
ncbi:MAG: hypothetical protein LBR38_09605 [Synergistaceae bacterium]|jgi:hypothetical protein|nr:hypothetical protein [Synergistaceae bacterium]